MQPLRLNQAPTGMRAPARAQCTGQQQKKRTSEKGGKCQTPRVQGQPFLDSVNDDDGLDDDDDGLDDDNDGLDDDDDGLDDDDDGLDDDDDGLDDDDDGLDDDDDG